MAKLGFAEYFVRPRRALLTKFSAALCLLALTTAMPAYASPTGPELRAAVIVAILRFTSWKGVVPDSDSSQIKLCTTGRPNSSSFLLSASGTQKVAGRTLVVDDVAPANLESQHCNAIVIGEKISKSDFADMIDVASKQSLLTICDGCKGMDAAETIIQLDLHKQRVKFEVNLIKARAVGVSLDAQLLELASVVRK